MFWSFSLPLPLLLFLPTLSQGRGHCANIAVEKFACQSSSSGHVSRRFLTLRDLAWLLTPHSYLITNGNQYTFRSIYEALLGKCPSDEVQIQGMRAGLDFDMRNLILFVEPVWWKNRTDTPFLHMICEPRVNPEMWYFIYTTLFKLLNRDFASIETALTSMAAYKPGIKEAIQGFGRFKCKANPTCANPGVSDHLCSPGVRMKKFNEWDVTLTWTDHISDTTRTGTGFVLQGCLNGKASWAMLSKVPHQSTRNMDEAHGNLQKRGGFGSGTSCWGNFNMWH